VLSTEHEGILLPATTFAISGSDSLSECSASFSSHSFVDLAGVPCEVLKKQPENVTRIKRSADSSRDDCPLNSRVLGKQVFKEVS
jgi:hypothetical protein